MVLTADHTELESAELATGRPASPMQQLTTALNAACGFDDGSAAAAALTDEGLSCATIVSVQPYDATAFALDPF